AVWRSRRPSSPPDSPSRRWSWRVAPARRTTWAGCRRRRGSASRRRGTRSPGGSCTPLRHGGGSCEVHDAGLGWRRQPLPHVDLGRGVLPVEHLVSPVTQSIAWFGPATLPRPGGVGPRQGVSGVEVAHHVLDPGVLLEGVHGQVLAVPG